MSLMPGGVGRIQKRPCECCKKPVEMYTGQKHCDKCRDAIRREKAIERCRRYRERQRRKESMSTYSRKEPLRARKPREAPVEKVAPPTRVVSKAREWSEDTNGSETTAEALKKIELEMARRDRRWR